MRNPKSSRKVERKQKRSKNGLRDFLRRLLGLPDRSDGRENSPSCDGHEPMKLIVGLGNPGRKYEQTRHNVGFMAAVKVAALVSASPSKTQFEGEVAEGRLGNDRLIVLCPHTFMNVSGKSVRKAYDFYKMSPENLLVICDDLNLASGRLRIRPSGSAGGQKGLSDIIRQLGTDAVARLRIGIGRPPPQWDAADYVLGKFSKDEQQQIESATTRAAHAAIDWATEGTMFAMNKYNADPSAAKAKQDDQEKQNDSSRSSNSAG